MALTPADKQALKQKMVETMQKFANAIPATKRKDPRLFSKEKNPTLKDTDPFDFPDSNFSFK